MIDVSVDYVNGLIEQVEAAEDRVRELTAENERLRAREEQREHAWSVDVAHRHRAESSLAAATELPGRIWEALGELTSFLMDGDHMVRVDDVRGVFERFLASAQPAAPARWRPDPDCGCCWCHDGIPSECCERPAREPQPSQNSMTEDEYYSYQPAAPILDTSLMTPEGRARWSAAPARTLLNAVTFTELREPTRTEAEQAVLDACEGLELDEGPHKLEGIWEVWAAELARRGLK